MGFTQRARKLQAAVKKSHRWIERLFEFQTKSYLAVFDEADWREACIPPYGTPHTVFDGPRGYVVSSYDYHAAMIDAMLRVVAAAPPTLEREFRKLKGSDESNIIKFLDLVVTSHEVAHLFIDLRKISLGPRWLGELFAHYLTYAHLRAENPNDARFWKLCNDIWASNPDVTYRALDDYDTHGEMPLENYIWFQGRLNARGVSLYSKMGTRFAHKIVEQFAVTEQQVYRRLNTIQPDFAMWIESFG